MSTLNGFRTEKRNIYKNTDVGTLYPPPQHHLSPDSGRTKGQDIGDNSLPKSFPSILNTYLDHHFNPPSIPLKPSLFLMGNVTTATDPTEAWIEFILQHGAFILLLGVPALAAWFAINYQSKQLEKLRPHSYGRTALIFWPSQTFIFLACLSLVGLLVALGWETTNGMWSGAFLMLFSWV